MDAKLGDENKYLYRKDPRVERGLAWLPGSQGKDAAAYHMTKVG